MCGISYTKLQDRNANRLTKKIYFHQKMRGQDGFGFVNVETMEHHRAKWEQEIFSLMQKHNGKEILFHHRNPTSTSNTVESAHPIFTDDPYYDFTYFLAHNGSIQNHEELRKEHNKLGIKYSTLGNHDGVIGYNDSESLLHELAMVIEGKKEYKDFNACGSMAFVLIQAERDGTKKEMFFGRNMNSQLKKYEKDGDIVISSEGPGVEVTPNKLYSIPAKEDVVYYRDVTFSTFAVKKYDTTYKTKKELEKELAELEQDKAVADSLMAQTTDDDEDYRLTMEVMDIDKRIKEIKEELVAKNKIWLPHNHNPHTLNGRWDDYGSNH